jgi:hypothetical protein
MHRTLCLIAVLATVLLTACDGYNSTTPPSSVPTPQLPVSIVVQGTVIDEAGEPLAGARVRLLGGAAASVPAATSTDTGRFQVFGAIAQAPPGGLLELEASGEGLDPTRVLVDIRAPRQTTLRLVRAPRLRAGEPLETRLFTDASACGFDYEFLCRRFELDGDAPDAFEVEIAPVDADGSVGLVVGSVTYPFAFQRRIVAPGGELWIYGLQPLAVRITARAR